MKFEYNEIISKIGIHTHHFEIWMINDDNIRMKLATAYHKGNAVMIVDSLNKKYGVMT